MALERIIYTSRATRPLRRSDLEAILDSAREKNAANDVTGYLLYDDGHFIQAIEGEDTVVGALAERIAEDERHEAFQVLAREVIAAREFDDWAMGCFHVEDARPHDANRLQSAMREFLDDSDDGFRETVGFFRLFLRFDRERPA